MKIFLCFLCCILCINSLVFGQNCAISKIEFKGSEKTNISFLKGLIETKEGAVFNEDLVKQDLTRLVRLPSVANATYTLETLNGNCILSIKLVKSATIIPFVNIFETSNEKVAYLLGVYEHDLFKRSISFGGWYQKNIFDSFGVGLRAPYLFSKNFGLAISAQNLSTQEPVFFKSGTALYKYTNRSVETLGLYQISFKNKISIGANFFKEIYEAIDLGSVVNAPSEYSLNKLLFKGIYTFDNLRYDYQYISGFKSIFNLQYVLPFKAKNENNFIIGWNDFLYFKRVGKKGNLAQRLRVGLSTNDESPFAPFSVDNNLNLRGVGNIIDRGTGVILLNTEYRYTFFDNEWAAVQSNVFVDAGTWRNPGGDYRDFTDENNVRVFSGLGLRFIHKKIFNLVLRGDFGYGLTKGEPYGLVFGIGQYF